MTIPKIPRGARHLTVSSTRRIATELINREFIVDYRPGAGVRISPHFYTKDEELELIIEEMKLIRDSHAYAKHETAGAAF